MKTLLKEENTPTTSKKTFVDENGIEIPYTQMDVHVKN